MAACPGFRHDFGGIGPSLNPLFIAPPACPEYKVLWVFRFRNFGVGALVNYEIACGFGFEVPMRICCLVETSNPPHQCLSPFGFTHHPQAVTGSRGECAGPMWVFIVASGKADEHYEEARA